jgi:hypothetical protein
MSIIEIMQKALAMNRSEKRDPLRGRTEPPHVMVILIILHLQSVGEAGKHARWHIYVPVS